MSDNPVTLSHRIEFALARALIGILRLVSWRKASAFGALLGRFAYSVVRIRRGVVERHLRAAFPDISEAEVNRLAKMSYESIGRTFIESFAVAGRSKEVILSTLAGIDGREVLDEAISEGKGVIFATGHLGNWELGGASLAAVGYPMGAIARQMANPLFDRFVMQTRNSMDVVIIKDVEAARRTPRVLREGKVIAFLCDQDGLGLASTFVPFFGRPARTARGAAVFAKRLGTPVLFASSIRQSDCRYRINISRINVADTGDLSADIDAIVAEYTAVLEEHIRRDPGQYFWHHRRWKRQPPGTPEHLREP